MIVIVKHDYIKDIKNLKILKLKHFRGELVTLKDVAEFQVKPGLETDGCEYCLWTGFCDHADAAGDTMYILTVRFIVRKAETYPFHKAYYPGRSSLK